MKVTTNTIGNYSRTYIPAQTKNKTENVQNTKNEKIGVEEKKFFAQLYPNQQDEIMDYKFYNSKGKVTGVHVGSLFDRRG
jgi:hypothetical protein